jgi:hypothetical protein
MRRRLQKELPVRRLRILERLMCNDDDVVWAHRCHVPDPVAYMRDQLNGEPGVKHMVVHGSVPRVFSAASFRFLPGAGTGIAGKIVELQNLRQMGQVFLGNLIGKIFQQMG